MGSDPAHRTAPAALRAARDARGAHAGDRARRRRRALDTVWVGDHVAIPVEVASRYPYHPSGKASFQRDAPFYDPFVLLAYVAGRTRARAPRLQRADRPAPPPAAARQDAGDAGPGCRAVASRSASASAGSKEEFEVLGLDFHRRGRETDAALDTMRAVWTASPAKVDGVRAQRPAAARPAAAADPGRRPRRRRDAARAARRQRLAGDGQQRRGAARSWSAARRELAGGWLPAGFEVSSRLHLPKFSADGSEGLSPDEIRAAVAAYADAGAQSLVLDVWDKDADRYLARIEALAGWLELTA